MKHEKVCLFFVLWFLTYLEICEGSEREEFLTENIGSSKVEEANKETSIHASEIGVQGRTLA